jgi:hypothetical protein
MLPHLVAAAVRVMIRVAVLLLGQEQWVRLYTHQANANVEPAGMLGRVVELKAPERSPRTAS